MNGDLVVNGDECWFNGNKSGLNGDEWWLALMNVDFMVVNSDQWRFNGGYCQLKGGLWRFNGD